MATQHPFGNRPDKEPVKPSAAMRPHDDQVVVAFTFGNHLRGVAPLERHHLYRQAQRLGSSLRRAEHIRRRPP